MFLLKQNDKIDYGYKEYYLDTEAELSLIDVRFCCPGSVAYVINTKKVFILNNNKE